VWPTPAVERTKTANCAVSPLTFYGVRRQALRGDRMTELDYIEFDIECPRCRFSNPVYLKQVVARDVVICRGCKANLQLDDYLNEGRRTKRQVEASLNELTAAFSGLMGNA
jgi:hypothetical protein